MPAKLVRVIGELVEDEGKDVRLPVNRWPLGMNGAVDPLGEAMKVAVCRLLRMKAIGRDGDER